MTKWSCYLIRCGNNATEVVLPDSINFKKTKKTALTSVTSVTTHTIYLVFKLLHHTVIFSRCDRCQASAISAGLLKDSVFRLYAHGII